MKTHNTGYHYLGLVSLLYLAPTLAIAAEPMATMSHADMDHSSMDMSGMDHSGMDHSGMDMSGMDHGSMDMSGMQGGDAPADARSPDYSNGVPYGRFGKPVMMGSLPLWGVSVETLGYQF